MREFDPVTLGILWDRLISITDEIVLSLVRTSFSINVREGYDLCCLLFDADGKQLAQGNYSVPSFAGTGPQTIAHMLAKFPPETLRPGDVIATNDPWMGTGHLYDINVMRPVFRAGQLVGYTMSITHLPDIGGGGFSSVPKSIYEEGLRLPVSKLVDGGQLNEPLIDLIRTNVRVSEQVIGDFMANITCNEVGGRLLVELMDEYGISDLRSLSDQIRNHSEKALRAEIEKLPDGVYGNRILIEGMTGPLELACTITIEGADLSVDFSGTSGSVLAAINVPLCYTRAWTSYAIKCLTVPEIPNNDGIVRPIRLTAPEGCILNTQPPFPTGGRHSVGHFVAPLIMGAFEKVLPERVQADVSMMNVLYFHGVHPEGQDFASLYFLSGGLGGMKGKDGPSTTPAPSNMSIVPSEIWENLTGMTVERRALLPDSGGAGEFRGGLGQEVVIRNDTGSPVTVAFMGQRTQFPAKGYHGGSEGKLRRYLIDGQPVNPKGRHELEPGQTVVTLEAGGGGYGEPRERKREAMLADLAAGLTTREGLERDYGFKA